MNFPNLKVSGPCLATDSILVRYKEVPQERRGYLIQCMSCSNQLKMELLQRKNGNLLYYL